MRVLAKLSIGPDRQDHPLNKIYIGYVRIKHPQKKKKKKKKKKRKEKTDKHWFRK